MFERYTESARQTIHLAKWEASRLGSKEIEPELILLGLLVDQAIMNDEFLSGGTQELRAEILSSLPQAEPPLLPTDLPLSDESKTALALAGDEAGASIGGDVQNWHILTGLLQVECVASQMLKRNGLSVEGLRSRTRIAAANSSRRSSTPPEGAESHLTSFTREIFALSKSARHKEALALLDEAMAKTTDVWHLLALCSLAIATARSSGDFNARRSYCERRLALDPEDPMILFELADCLALQGEMDLAKKQAVKSYELSMAKGGVLGKGVLQLLERRFPEIKRNA
jgi:tetratricopeptide (TPR) repeat protein